MARLFWRLFFPFLYFFLRVTDPFFTRLTERRGLVNSVELRVRGRRSGRERRLVLGLLAVGDRRYLGHATDRAAWTRNLTAAGEGSLVVDGGAPIHVTATPLVPGEEQDEAVRAGGRQHPFPVDVAYRRARASIRLDGVFFRVESPDGRPIPLPARARGDG
ncbi:MAG TPA: hypothetical protein VIF84_03630 [Candidatus Limnocylindrales bacterium]|jgi:hypothetical protein